MNTEEDGNLFREESLEGVNTATETTVEKIRMRFHEGRYEPWD